MDAHLTSMSAHLRAMLLGRRRCQTLGCTGGSALGYGARCVTPMALTLWKRNFSKRSGANT
ncbi:hypothetical protein EF294_02670 [Gordonia oryzae]|uniref:Uncharacterized protein n=1 Tax=Gordonia oryzae TaxID=2487349 RepID=A0A3N4HFS8_9ACTN|nr:hypothetical protein EF294_02670 [Gordonia oryzae]